MLKTITDKEIFSDCVSILNTIFSKENFITFETKSDGSLCSNLEKIIQHQIGSYLKEQTPEIKFVCEEDNDIRFYANELVWYLDPIDGTISFKNNIDLFAVTLTLSFGLTPIASLIYFPKTKNAYVSYSKQGTFKNNVNARIKNSEEEKFCVLCHSDIYTFELSGRLEWLDVIKKVGYIPRTYTDIFGYSLVVDGCAVGKFDAACAIWDMLPAFLLIKEAGGSVIIYMHNKPTLENVCSMLVGSKDVVAKIDNMICSCTNFDSRYRFIDCIPDVKF